MFVYSFLSQQMIPVRNSIHRMHEVHYWRECAKTATVNALKVLWFLGTIFHFAFKIDFDDNLVRPQTWKMIIL